MWIAYNDKHMEIRLRTIIIYLGNMGIPQKNPKAVEPVGIFIGSPLL